MSHLSLEELDWLGVGGLGGPLDVAGRVTDWWGLTTRTYPVDPTAPSTHETNVLGEIKSAVASAKEQAYQGYFADADYALMQATRAYNTLTDSRYRAQAQALIEEGDRYVVEQKHVHRSAPELTEKHRDAFGQRVEAQQGRTRAANAAEEERRKREAQARMWRDVAIVGAGLLIVGYASGNLARLFGR